MTKSQHRQDQRGGAADEQQDPATCRDMQCEREGDLCDTGEHEIDAEGDGGSQDGYLRPGQYHDTEDQRQNSREQRGFPQMRQQAWDRKRFHCTSVTHVAILV
ncbi:hypothetical protein AWC22_17575 [Mycobacterium riyadhense]|uniref:Uncharacterized protein n=1 Tax=Mycobacterium riyadhense TaxID=486698 RepID=A0A1X2CYG3_9MYCO|nr:hypothetical protein AWC22_17575 [Mycobacterium riyadhense]